jgi:hypothetical protein
VPGICCHEFQFQEVKYVHKEARNLAKESPVKYFVDASSLTSLHGSNFFVKGDYKLVDNIRHYFLPISLERRKSDDMSNFSGIRRIAQSSIKKPP